MRTATAPHLASLSMVVFAAILSQVPFACWGAGAEPQEKSLFSPESLLPAHTKLLVCFPDLSASSKRFQGTALCDIWREEEVQAIVRALAPRAKMMMGEVVRRLGIAADLGSADLKLPVLGGLAIALVDFDPGSPSRPPDLAAFLKTEDRSSLESLLEKVITMMSRNRVV